MKTENSVGILRKKHQDVETQKQNLEKERKTRELEETISSMSQVVSLLYYCSYGIPRKIKFVHTV